MLDWKTVKVKENSLVSFKDDLHDDCVTMTKQAEPTELLYDIMD